jgi:hypothetical protein
MNKTTTSALQKIILKNAFTVYVPSLKREVKFTPITVSQQKKLYECASDNLVFQTKFIVATYEIIKENCLEPELVDGFNVFDRISVLIALRVNLFNTTDIAIDENIKGSVIEVQDRLKATDYTQLDNQIETPYFVFEMQIPKLLDSYKIENELRKNTQPSEDYVKVFSDVYTSELIKIIKEIHYRTELDGDLVAVNYTSKPALEKIQIISSLPAEVIKDIRAYLLKYYKVCADILTLTLDKETNLKTTLDIRADFFIE